MGVDPGAPGTASMHEATKSAFRYSFFFSQLNRACRAWRPRVFRIVHPLSTARRAGFAVTVQSNDAFGLPSCSDGASPDRPRRVDPKVPEAVGVRRARPKQTAVRDGNGLIAEVLQLERRRGRRRGGLRMR
jgi:hypothetical protein